MSNQANNVSEIGHSLLNVTQLHATALIQLGTKQILIIQEIA